MNPVMEKLLRKLLRGSPKVSLAEIQLFVTKYADASDSDLRNDAERVLEMLFAKQPRGQVPPPPAGLKAKQAVPIMLAYIKEEMGKQITLSREERGSYSAMVEALDRRFGEGFTARVVRELNALPNGSTSLHYES